MIAEPKEKGLFYISYDGLGFAANIGDNSIDEVFDAAKSAIKKQMEKENERQEEREEVRSQEERQDSSSAEPVDGDSPAGGISSQVHGPEKPDVR